jgi:hypothetical protein
MWRPCLSVRPSVLLWPTVSDKIICNIFMKKRYRSSVHKFIEEAFVEIISVMIIFASGRK